jgi:hypothetical protein
LPPLHERFYIQHLDTCLNWTLLRGGKSAVWFSRFEFAHNRMVIEAERRPGIAHRVVSSTDKGYTVRPVGIWPFSFKEVNLP